VAERGKARRYTLQLEYRFDRLLTIKLERVYQLLVPDKRWPLGSSAVSITLDRYPEIRSMMGGTLDDRDKITPPSAFGAPADNGG
jgi:hypothetical protein